MITEYYNIEDLEHKYKPLWRHEKGLTYTRTGYGKDIPTPTIVKLPDSNRWRRIYCAIYSNSGTCYVKQGKNWIVIR